MKENRRRKRMPSFRLCFLYGKSHCITIDKKIVDLENLRKSIQEVLPPLREIDDYICIVSGKPPWKLNLNDENEFNQHRTLITDGCYVWMKLK